MFVFFFDYDLHNFSQVGCFLVLYKGCMDWYNESKPTASDVWIDYSLFNAPNMGSKTFSLRINERLV